MHAASTFTYRSGRLRRAFAGQAVTVDGLFEKRDTKTTKRTGIFMQGKTPEVTGYLAKCKLVKLVSNVSKGQSQA